MSDVGQNQVEEINRVVLGGDYGWPVKEGTFLFNRTIATGPPGTIGARSPGVPVGMIDPISGPLGFLEYDHSDGISITGGFVYRGTAIPELYGKYVFGDLAIRNAPPRVDGRLFYADLASGEMLEFRLPLLANDRLPNRLTVHGFGEDASGELYAAVTNTPANGVGGILYKLTSVVPVGFNLKPETIKLNSRDMPKRVHAFIEPPAPFSPEGIDVASIRLNGVVPVDLTAPQPVIVGDEDDDGIPDLKVYFLRNALELILPIGDQVPVKLTGFLGPTQAFEGFDVIRVRGGHVLTPVANEVLEPGATYPISYDVTSGTAQWVALMFSPDGGAEWSTQMTQIPNTGTFNWLVPSYYTDNALVAVVEVEEGEVGVEDVVGVLAVSDPFSIHGTLAASGAGRATRLLPPSPNPSWERVNLGFSLARDGEVEVAVFDLQGRQVAAPTRGIREAGVHEVVWDGRLENGRKAEAGLYFVRLRAEGREWRERLVRLN